MADYLKNIYNELKINAGIKSKLSVLTYRLFFISKFEIQNIGLKKIILIIAYILKVICWILSCGDIPPKDAFIDYGLRLPHAFCGIYINPKVKIGKNSVLFHNVTLGAIEKEDEYIVDINIGNNVYIGTGAIVLGKVNIGNNCKIGAGALIINRTIKSNHTVINKVSIKELDNKNGH
ncbi:hypothetical protein [Clostridium tyrobutyricum]|uniref:hypothetical protein n=1 Tax=Clostridium tyrobutyricum TaxID=1519 RepID=UPI001C387831|nr:hypothetical protein [Clostridium tyrobutyricum]MBV4423554.1 hypothetical protein [Clostridium tyrobutyricum]